MSLSEVFFQSLGDLKFRECMETLRKLRAQSPNLKKWFGHLVMCEKDYYKARFGTDKSDSLQQRYSFLQSKVFEMTKNAPFETTGSNDDMRLKMSRRVKYNDQYGIIITRQMWTSLLNFVSTRERLCTLYEMISKSKPPHHYDYFCLETVEIQKNTKITHPVLKMIQQNMTCELGILFKSFRCESYIDKLRYTECLFAFWSVRESLRTWRDLHRNIEVEESDSTGKKSPSEPFQFSSPARFPGGRTDSPSARDSGAGPSSPSISASFRPPPSQGMVHDPKKTMSFRIRAQESLSTLRKFFRFGKGEDERLRKSLDAVDNNTFQTPPKNRPSVTLTPNQIRRDTPGSNNKKRPLSTDPTKSKQAGPSQSNSPQSVGEAKSLLENYDLYKWMKILHGYTFSKFTFFFHDILSRPFGSTLKGSSTMMDFEKVYSEVGINYVERIKQFFYRDLGGEGIDHAFLMYKGKRNYGTLTLDPKRGYSIDLNLDLNETVDKTFQGIKSYPCLFFHNFAEEREKILKDHMGDNKRSNSSQEVDEENEGKKKKIEEEKEVEGEEEEDYEEEEEEEEEVGIDEKERKMMRKQRKKSQSRFESVGKAGKSAVVRSHWANILNLIWADEVKMAQERKPMFFMDSRAGIGYYYMKVGEDIYFIFVNREGKRTKNMKRKKIMDFMTNMNVFLQNKKLFEYLQARAPES